MATSSAHRDLIRRLAEQQGLRAAGAVIREVPAAHYLSAEHFALERRRVFARLPAVVALEADADLAEVGACITAEVAGVPAIIVRGEHGSLHAFRNACRHRGTELVQGACRKKAFVCPYHGWTYALDGALQHVPHEASFGGRAAERGALAPLHVAARHGLVFAGLEPFAAPEFLGPIDAELAEGGPGSWPIYRKSTRQVAGNWKLIIDAFLDGYHVRHLHRDSVYRFFLDARSDADRAGPHIRAMTARRALRDVDAASLARERGLLRSLEGLDLRQLATPSYLIFPSTILILHPDYLSVLVATPLAPARTQFTHWMLVPQLPRSAAEEAHWQKSFELIDEGVFAREDLFAVEAMQRGLSTGANETLLFGELEFPAAWFHDALGAMLDAAEA